MYVGALVCCTLVAGTMNLIAYDEDDDLAHVCCSAGLIYEVPLATLSRLEDE